MTAADPCIIFRGVAASCSTLNAVPKLNLIKNLALNDDVSLDIGVIHSMILFSLWVNNLKAKTSGLSIWQLKASGVIPLVAQVLTLNAF